MKNRTDTTILIENRLTTNLSGTYAINPHRLGQLEARVFRKISWCGYFTSKPNRRKEALKARRKLRKKLAEYQYPDGTVAVYVWGRDCDLCESDSITNIPANLKAYEKFEQDQYDMAEGPTVVHPVSPEEADKFRPSFRDRILEAYEDGHPHHITVTGS